MKSSIKYFYHKVLCCFVAGMKSCLNKRVEKVASTKEALWSLYKLKLYKLGFQLKSHGWKTPYATINAVCSKNCWATKLSRRSELEESRHHLSRDKSSIEVIQESLGILEVRETAYEEFSRSQETFLAQEYYQRAQELGEILINPECKAFLEIGILSQELGEILINPECKAFLEIGILSQELVEILINPEGKASQNRNTVKNFSRFFSAKATRASEEGFKQGRQRGSQGRRQGEQH